jgi:hypothetical protein
MNHESDNVCNKATPRKRLAADTKITQSITQPRSIKWRERNVACDVTSGVLHTLTGPDRWAACRNSQDKIPHRNSDTCMAAQYSLQANRGGIFKLLWSPEIDCKESIRPAYVAWRAGTTTIFLLGS